MCTKSRIQEITEYVLISHIHTYQLLYVYIYSIHLNLTPGWYETSTAAKPSPRNNPSVMTKLLQWWRSWQVSVCRRCCPPWHQGRQPNHGLIALVQLQPCLNLFTIPVHGGHVATYLILVSKKSESATVAQPSTVLCPSPSSAHKTWEHPLHCQVALPPRPQGKNWFQWNLGESMLNKHHKALGIHTSPSPFNISGSVAVKPRPIGHLGFSVRALFWLADQQQTESPSISPPAKASTRISNQHLSAENHLIGWSTPLTHPFSASFERCPLGAPTHVQQGFAGVQLRRPSASRWFWHVSLTFWTNGITYSLFTLYSSDPWLLSPPSVCPKAKKKQWLTARPRTKAPWVLFGGLHQALEIHCNRAFWPQKDSSPRTLTCAVSAAPGDLLLWAQASATTKTENGRTNFCCKWLQIQKINRKFQCLVTFGYLAISTTHFIEIAILSPSALRRALPGIWWTWSGAQRIWTWLTCFPCCEAIHT